MPTNNKTYFLGIDGGGSKCKAIIVSEDNKVLGTGVSGPANPIHGFEQATHSITESALLALDDAKLDDVKLCDLVAGVGLAGVNLPVLFEQMSAWQHPFRAMFLTTDLLIACLGAHQGQDGAVMISGTGSCGFSYVDETPFIVGAHGFPHGDKGSGAWIGLQATKNVLLSLDGLIAPTSLSEDILNHTQAKDAVSLVEAIAGKPATYYAKLASYVFKRANEGDAIAKAIILEGAQYLSQVAKRLSQQNPPRISIIGGLSSFIVPWLEQDVQASLSEPVFPPEMGSVLFAQQQLANATH
ncbi:ATPase [Thalassotalea sp. LPB0316]|uniref:N-acetylglucosamine kinase n=1 Tax=Thalassotalea sp. LPB0316 TaxID=2769490 RepID=UPI001868645C|nr:BadF/BadG/BcrA/BcrD ATPase family protein [Thalassotalea sp. LPB0316]QOL25529.1 ATPase [Thalassotalea sp. LPB0316]